VVIRGRRRIGKSRLAEEFAKDKIFLPFTGLAPTEHINDQSQRDAFARQLAKNFKFPPLTFLDWQDAFEHLSNSITNKKTVILFDEISWMGAKDPTSLSKLKAWWDLSMQKFPNVVLILCGSVSTWISENIIRSTAFFGRISLDLTLDELTLSESFAFLKKRGVKCSTYDIFKITSITGGVPWYLEQINSKYTIDENIKNLCYDKDGLLVKEFDLIFNDLFGNKGSIYKKILYILADGMKDLAEIRNILEYSHSGRMSEYLNNLIISGFIPFFKLIVSMVLNKIKFSLKNILVTNRKHPRNSLYGFITFFIDIINFVLLFVLL
jgi:AAA+ ATPase superfamily predicted ATPase